MSAAAAARSVRSLQEASRTGEKPKYLHFWGHRGGSISAPTSACLSQWFDAPFEVGGLRYATAEHFMMAEKAAVFGDEARAEAARAAASPGAAKAIGRAVAGFDELVWSKDRWEIVVRANVAKFGAHPALAEFLLATGDRVLVEASPHDRIWGVGLDARAAAAAGPSGWQGQNLLGFALMETRSRLGA